MRTWSILLCLCSDSCFDILQGHGPCLRLLLIDEAQMLFPAGVADSFWMNIKSLLDGGSNLPNIRVILFAMLGDQPSGLVAINGSPAPTPPQFSGGSRIDFEASESQSLKLALSEDEYAELWQSFEVSCKSQGLFQDQELQGYLYQVMGGHVSSSCKAQPNRES